MSWEAWLTLGVVVATLTVMILDMISPTVAVVGAVVFLLVANVIDADQAFSGFSNSAPITVAALLILARAVDRTGALQPLLARTLAGGNGDRRGLVRLLAPAAISSAFLNNIPIVAMLSGQVRDWASRRGTSPSKYLMPLSFAVILGGMVTVIGTSTNIVVSGFLSDAGFEPIGLFEITKVGLPVALIGIAAVILLAPLVLPDRSPARSDVDLESREFVVDMEVIPGGPVDGKTVAEGGLRHLTGVYLVQVERRDELIAPVPPETVLRGGDLLRFVGRADLVVDLHSTRGLVAAEPDHRPAFDLSRTAFFEAVIGADSPLVGQTLRESEFRARYQAAVVAIHRAGERVVAKLGDVRLRVGDTLLLFSDPSFRNRWYDRNDFLLVSPFGQQTPTSSRKAVIVGLVTVGIIALATSGVLPILEAALVGAVALVVTGVLTPGQARAAVDLDIVILMAAAFGLGAAVESSGLATEISRLLIDSMGRFGVRGALLGIVLATVLLTELITNAAAAAIIFPIAIVTATSVGQDPRGWAIAVALSASASFLTPIGYQTNTMVYGPGGYRFTDYVRLGLPLTLLVSATVVWLVPVFWA